MKEQKTTFCRALIILALALSLTQAGCRDRTTPSPAGEHAEHGHEGHNHGAEHPGHASDGEGGEHEERNLSLQEIAGEECEHEVLAYKCDECRYEVGTVKVPDALMKETSSDGKGLVLIQPVSTQKISDGLMVTGEVQLNQNATVHITPRISGVIDAVKVDMGTSVEKEEPLLTISSVALGEALNNYKRSRSLAVLSRKVYEREKDLYERKLTSEQDMIEAQMEYEQHEAEKNAALQTLQVIGLNKKDLAAIERGSPDTGSGTLTVRAPMAGTILEKHAAVGELVEAGQELMLLSDLGTLWVWTDIYEQDLARLLEARKRGPIQVEVFVRAFPDRPFQAEINYVGMIMDEKTRTVKVRALVQNPDMLLRPGMFCEARIEIADGGETLVVPKSALLDDEGNRFVFLHWKDDYFVRRPVRTGRDLAGNVEIVEGLNPGDRIVTEGAFLLKSDVLREKMGAGCAD